MSAAPESARPALFGPPSRAEAAKESGLDDLVEEARALGTNAAVGIDPGYETVGESMLMVTAAR